MENSPKVKNAMKKALKHINSMTDAELSEALKKIKPDSLYDRLCESIIKSMEVPPETMNQPFNI